MINERNRLWWDDLQKIGKHGATDQKRLLDLVIAHNIPAYGLVCIAYDTSVSPRSIKEIKGDYLVRLQIKKESDGIYGKHCGQILMAQLVQDVGKLRESPNNGLLDLANPPAGSDIPDRALTSGWSVVRDSKVRAYVIDQAGGRCEYCGKEGFLMSNGKRYTEAHHIIALSAQGKDVVENVIALCPEHHREAHFGVNAEKLETEFIKCIRSRRTTKVAVS